MVHVVVVVTTGVQSTREGSVYIWQCLSVHTEEGGIPSPSHNTSTSTGSVSSPRCYPIILLTGPRSLPRGYPIQDWMGAAPPLPFGDWMGVLPIWNWMALGQVMLWAVLLLRFPAILSYWLWLLLLLLLQFLLL